MLRRLRAAAPHVAVLTDPPRPAARHPRLRVGRACRTSAAARSRAAKAVARGGSRSTPPSGACAASRTIDPTSHFCLADLCPAVIGDVLVYRNSGHITASFIATLAPWLERQLPRL